MIAELVPANHPLWVEHLRAAGLKEVGDSGDCEWQWRDNERWPIVEVHVHAMPSGHYSWFAHTLDLRPEEDGERAVRTSAEIATVGELRAVFADIGFEPSW